MASTGASWHASVRARWRGAKRSRAKSADADFEGIELQDFMASIVELNKEGTECTFDLHCADDRKDLALICWAKADLNPTDESAMYYANPEMRSLLEDVTRNTNRPADSAAFDERSNVRIEAALCNL
eukprot:1567742-Pleurochrysis_carterae.AAC.1